MIKSGRGNNWHWRRGLQRYRAGILLLLALVVLNPGCTVLQTPQRVVNAVVPTANRSSQLDPIDLQNRITRFSDDFSGRTVQSLDEYARSIGTEQGRIQALQLKLMSVSAVVAIASGPNPYANLLDLVTMNTLTRMTIEDYWIKTPGGQAFGLWLENARTLETNAWDLAATVLKPEQLKELRSGIKEWYAQNPAIREGFLARPHELASLVAGSKERKGDLNSVFTLMGLDPTIGLDPAVREVTQTRLFAERAMFTFQRMPFLLRFQTELLAYQLAHVPEAQLVLTNTTKISDSAERISQTAAELPDRLTAERKAILAALEQQEGKLHDLSTEVNRTLVSGAKMSDSLNTTITTFDGLMKRFGVGEPDTNSVPDTNSPPFNILDYGKVADQIGSMSRDLNTLLTTANQNVTQLTKLSDEATAKADRVVDRAFHRGIALIVIFLVGAVLAGLSYRIFAKKVTRD